jgi:hypothetical protein
MRTRLLIPFALLLLLPAVSFAARSRPARKWPSVEKQLARDHVIPGSALEKLIRANQDASVLAPWEADDDEIGLPLWLRVLWRKAHPDVLGEAEDAGGGYPLGLKEEYEWLVHHQDLRRGRPEPSTPPIKRLTAGGNVRISGLSPNSRAESDIRVLPSNPNVIVAACNNNTETGRQTQMYSLDGGNTWGQTTLPLVGNDAFHSDPAVDFTSDGVAWSLTMGVESGTTVRRVRAYHSVGTDYSQWVLDNAATVGSSPPILGTPSAGQTDADKELMWIDHSATSSHRDTLYAIWNAGSPSYLPTYISHRSPGSPSGWSVPLQLNTGIDSGRTTGADVKTNANGDAFAFWPAGPKGRTIPPRIYATKSTDGGASFSVPSIVDETNGSYQIGVPAFNGLTHKPLVYTSGGAFRDGSKNLVYVAWMDLNNKTDCNTTCPNPAACPTSNCKTRIWFKRSTDGGATWTEPKRMIKDQPNTNDQFNPRLLVDEATGVLTIIYYDTILDPNRLQTHVFAQRSTDDGASWEEPVQVTTVASDETNGNPVIQYGDYNGIAGQAGVVFPSWTDHRNSVEEIWTARLTDSPPPAVPTSLVATATSTSQISLTWTASAGATSYQVQRSSDGGAFQPVATPATASYTDNGVAASKTYVYRVLAVSSSGTSAPSTPDLATTLVFTDDPVTAGGIVKAVHLTELRQAVNLVRAAAGLAAASFTDSPPTVIKAVHISELRSALDPARSALGVPTLTYTNPTLTPQATVVRAVHIQELRNGVK